MALEISWMVKPLYANLLRLDIADFLKSKEFSVLLIEHDWDVEWNAIRKDEDHITSLGLLIDEWYHNSENGFSLLYRRVNI